MPKSINQQAKGFLYFNHAYQVMYLLLRNHVDKKMGSKNNKACLLDWGWSMSHKLDKKSKFYVPLH